MKKIIYNSIELLKFIDSIDFNEPKIVTVEKHEPKRNVPQNALYWLWLTCIENETGTDKDDLHEFFKNKFLKKQIIECLNENFAVVPTTTKLKKSEFAEYLQKIQRFVLLELEINLPNPEDLQFENFKNHYEKYL
jgi:hypothetical protein